jgi:superfamily II DNA or RNA helicase
VPIKLRPYQEEAVAAVLNAWRSGVRRPAVVLPTGAGKTVIIGEIVRQHHAATGKRAVVLAHRTELVEQNAAKVRAVAPGLTVGIVKAGRNETLANVVSASVQTLASDVRRRQLLDIGLVVVDECHHAPSRTYQETLNHFGCYSDTGAVAVGLTATLSRGDGVALGDVWKDVVYTKEILWMIDHGYLVRPRCTYVRVDDLDFSKVKKIAGDYSESQLGAAIEDSMAPEAIAKGYREHASERSGLIFAPTVSSATMICDAMVAADFTAKLIHGGTPADERREILAAFERGDVQVLVNCMVLTEGTDLPRASCVVIARPTAHSGLYIQMVGRVLRLYPGKTDALVLDVVGASHRHALVSPMELFGEEAVIERDKPDAEDDDAEDVELVDQDEVTATTIFGNPGNLVAEDVDLFHGSASAWLITHGGTWFLPAGERYIAILPGVEAGTFDVVAMHRFTRGDSRWVIRGVPDRGYAMAWAEGDVTPAEQVISRRDRAWRAKKPSPKTLELAAKCGVLVTSDMHAGEVSSKIAVAMGSRRIDNPIRR